MSQNIPGAVAPDGFVSQISGQDAGSQPNLIQETNFYCGVNVTCNNGILATRPGFLQCTQKFSNNTDQVNFQTGNPQGMGTFQVGSSTYLICSIGGRIFYVEVTNSFNSVDITPVGDLNSSNLPKAYMCQAEEYFIVQDGVSAPIIINSLAARRAGPTEVPVGTAMAYGWGRLWVAKDNEFVAGDIVGGDTSVISFTETTYFAEGGAFKLPSTCGNLTGMVFIPLQDTATGQGQLLVGGEFGIASINGGIPRDQWKTTQIQQIAQLDVGFVGQNSNALLNGDVFYRAFDGIRSYRMARAEQGLNGNTPQSNEVSNFTDTDTQQFLQYSSAVYFNNRVLMTTNPVFKGTYCYHKGLLSLNSQPQSTKASKSPPIWEGVWTGLNVVQIVKSIFGKRERCFALVRNANNDKISAINALTEIDIAHFVLTVDDSSKFTVNQTYMDANSRVYFQVTSIPDDTSIQISILNNVTSQGINVGDVIVKGEYNEIWEISRDAPFDILENEKVLIQSKVWTRSFTHSSPSNQKKLVNGEMWVQDVIGTVNWSVSYRPDQYPCMFPWKSGTVCSENEVCDEQCPTSLNRHPGYRPRIMFGTPSQDCNPQTGEAQNLGFEFQWLIQWEGHMKIRSARETCTDVIETVRSNSC
jgi:hypothetical protein